MTDSCIFNGIFLLKSNQKIGNFILRFCLILSKIYVILWLKQIFLIVAKKYCQYPDDLNQSQQPSVETNANASEAACRIVGKSTARTEGT